MKLKVRPHATWFSFRAEVQWKIRLYIECIAGDSPKRNICDISASVCVCACCAHMQCELYKNRILNEVIRRGEAYAEKTSMELCIFFSCKWYGGFYPLLTFSRYMHAGKYLDFTASISYRFNQVNIFFPEINVLASESKENVKFEIRNI